MGVFDKIYGQKKTKKNSAQGKSNKSEDNKEVKDYSELSQHLKLDGDRIIKKGEENERI